MEEFYYGTNVWSYDTDGDELSDGDEILIYGTDALSIDTDGDGEDDSFEIIHDTDPLDPEDHTRKSQKGKE